MKHLALYALLRGVPDVAKIVRISEEELFQVLQESNFEKFFERIRQLIVALVHMKGIDTAVQTFQLSPEVISEVLKYQKTLNLNSAISRVLLANEAGFKVVKQGRPGFSEVWDVDLAKSFGMKSTLIKMRNLKNNASKEEVRDYEVRMLPEV